MVKEDLRDLQQMLGQICAARDDVKALDSIYAQIHSMLKDGVSEATNIKDYVNKSDDSCDKDCGACKAEKKLEHAIVKISGLDEIEHVKNRSIILAGLGRYIADIIMKNYTTITPVCKEDFDRRKAVAYFVSDGKVVMCKMDFLENTHDDETIEERSLEKVLKSNIIEKLRKNDFNVYVVKTRSKQVPAQGIIGYTANLLQKQFEKHNPQLTVASPKDFDIGEIIEAAARNGHLRSIPISIDDIPEGMYR